MCRKLPGRLLAFALAEEDDGTAPDRQEVLRMCEEWWMWRRRHEAEETRRFWDEFDRTPPVREPERADEYDVTLEERDETPTAAER
jgi:hypothetical protein